MISVTKLNGKEHVINALFIDNLEATPDTMVTLITGKKYVVRESVEEVVLKAQKFYQEISLLQSVGSYTANGEKDS